MKADKYGTAAEQRLHRIGWTPVGVDGKRCENCAHFELSFERSRKGSPVCWMDTRVLHPFRTLIRSMCSHWEDKRK